MIPKHKMIKMRALDKDDLHHIAEQLRDGLCPILAMVHEKESFTLLVNRFCWNHEDKIEDETLHYRSHVGLLFRHVEKVQRKGFEQHSKERILNLLHIHLKEEKASTWVHLVFSKGCEIRLCVKKLEAYLSDLHDPWPTRSKPTHIHEHLEELAS
ncbi:MAG: DUF2948 family protein [Pseudomonadota bacterium]|jgi:hypothetical protein|nr:DUF2948 family protein [Alphaproteobacteria bacterium]